MGSLQISCFFDGGTFWVLSLTYFYLHKKSARAYLFPHSVECYYFAAAPLVSTPFVSNQQEFSAPRGRIQFRKGLGDEHLALTGAHSGGTTCLTLLV